MNFKYYHTGTLILIIISLSVVIDSAITSKLYPYLTLHFHLGPQFKLPTTETIVGGILLVYNEYLWKLPVFNYLVSLPNMNGRYEGRIAYERLGKSEEKNCVIEIKQSASMVKVCSYFNNDEKEKTSSISLIEEIKKDDNGFYTIHMFYLNGGAKIDGSLDCHEGACTLKFLPDKEPTKRKLIGHYFTNRLKQTRGEIEATYSSAKINGKF